MNQLREGVDLKTYMGLYTAIHNFCTSQKAVGNAASNSLATNHRGGGQELSSYVSWTMWLTFP